MTGSRPRTTAMSTTIRTIFHLGEGGDDAVDVIDSSSLADHSFSTVMDIFYIIQ